MTPSCHPMAASGAASLDVPLVFLAGLAISLGHCVGMCGPIQSAFVVSRVGGTGLAALRGPLLRYHTGRILSYALIGAGLGLAGTAARAGGLPATLQGALSLGLGLAILPIAFGVLGLVATPSWGWIEALGRGVAQRFRRLLAAPGAGNQFGLGMLNGFLPCGPVWAVALTAAAASHVLIGAGLMVVYGLGTLPALLVLALGFARLGPRLRLGLHRASAVVLMLVAGQLALRGLAILGVAPHAGFGTFVLW